MPLHLIGSDQGPALGSAMHAAVAAGVHPDIHAAAAAMGSVAPRRLRARRRARRRLRRALRALLRLHDHFGRGGDDVMHRLRDPRPREAGPWLISTACAREVCALHAELPRNGLVAWTSGQPVGARAGRGADGHQGQRRPLRRADARRRSSSATSTATLVEGELRAVQRRRDARLRLPAHARGRRHRAHPQRLRDRVGDRAASRSRACMTAMADEFGGEIPVGPFALIGDEEIGRGVVETLAGHRSPAVLMRSHGVFTLGAEPARAIKAAVMCEDVARTVHLARALGDRSSRSSRRTSTRSTTATRTSTASAEHVTGRSATRRPAADRPARRSCRSSTTTCCRASPSARRPTPREVAAALGGVADVEVAAAGQGPRRRPSARCATSRPRTSTACSS